MKLNIDIQYMINLKDETEGFYRFTVHLGLRVSIDLQCT